LNLNGGTVQVGGVVYLARREWWNGENNGTGTLVIGGDGSGRLINANGNAASIDGTAPDDAFVTGTGVVKFAHSGSIQFANVISGTNINIEHDSGHTTLTADSVIKNLNVTGGTINVADGIIVDFSALTETGTYLVLDWTGATGSVTDSQFSDTGLGKDVQGSFTVNGTQLFFTTNAIPEPSTYFLLGVGLSFLTLTACRRRKVQA
jgi:hypothetical protein